LVSGFPTDSHSKERPKEATKANNFIGTENAEKRKKRKVFPSNK